MKEKGVLFDVRGSLSFASIFVSLVAPIVDSFFNGEIAKMWFYAWLIQFIVSFVIFFTLYNRDPKEISDKRVLRLLPKGSVELLKELGKAGCYPLRRPNGSVTLNNVEISAIDLERLSMFGLVEKTPQQYQDSQPYRISLDGYRVLALAERSRP